MVNETLTKMKDLELEMEENSNTTNNLDCDTCDSDELNSTFSKSEHVVEHNVALNKKYILSISSTIENTPNIAVNLSDKTCEIFHLSNSQIAKINVLKEHTGTLVDVKFSTDNNNLLYTGSNDGTIKLWDLRTQKQSVTQFTDKTKDEKGKRCIGCFDISPNNRLLCAGTDIFKGDSYILFWDVRKNNLLGAYWESHTDDVTQVKFHSSDPNKLISGSTDGLINLYNLSESTEDDALSDTFNTESSVEKIDWFEENGNDIVTCITHTAHLQLWRLEDAEPYFHLERGDIAREIKRQSEDDSYIVNAHPLKNSLLVLAGSNVGDGECFRAVTITNKVIKPKTNFIENKQRVRSSWMNSNLNLLLTGGEKGILNVWRMK